MAGRQTPIAERLVVEQAVLGPLPTQPPDIGVVREVVVRSTGRVRFDANEYSVPLQFAYQRLLLKADPFRVCLYAGADLVATHPRSYAKHTVVDDWRHYVRALLDKPFALPFAAAVRHALATGQLPAHWEQHRQELVARRADGNREFARILELAAAHPLDLVDAALQLAIQHPNWDADLVSQLLGWLQQPTQTAAPLDAARYPAYQVLLPPPDLRAYNRLLEVRP